MGDVRLVAPRVRVVRANADEPLEIQADNRDLLAWEQTALRHKWGSLQDRPFKWLTFLAWSAARRSGEIESSVTYEAWESEVLSVGDLASENGTPTDAEHGTASS